MGISQSKMNPGIRRDSYEALPKSMVVMYLDPQGSLAQDKASVSLFPEGPRT